MVQSPIFPTTHVSGCRPRSARAPRAPGQIVRENSTGFADRGQFTLMVNFRMYSYGTSITLRACKESTDRDPRSRHLATRRVRNRLSLTSARTAGRASTWAPDGAVLPEAASACGMQFTEIIAAEAGHPPQTSRNGYPCANGMSSPFI